MSARLDRPTVGFLVVLVLLHGVMAFNATHHNPTLQYDGGGHVEMVETWAKGQRPTRADSHEYFSPPVPYALPAVLVASGMDTRGAMRVGQWLNLLLSLLLCWTVWRIARMLAPQSRIAGTLAVGFLGLLPVYYRTFSFVRGEPFVAVFGLLATFYAIRLSSSQRATWTDTMGLGFSTGLCVLSRQWGIPLTLCILGFVAVLAWFDRGRSTGRFRAIAVAAAIAAGTSVWFYVMLHSETGTPMAFNRTGTESFEFSNQGRDFYLGTGGAKVFSDPLHPALRNQAWPILYADTWGDYWGYFLWPHSAERPARQQIGPTLARASLLGLLPSLLAILGLGYACRTLSPRRLGASGSETDRIACLLLLCIAGSLVAYLWFLIRYPNHIKGNTIKASYVLSVYPYVGLLMADFLTAVQRRAPRLVIGILIALAIVYLFNIRLYTTALPG